MAWAKSSLTFCALALILCNIVFANADPHALASPTTSLVVNNEAFSYNFSDFGNDVLTELSPDQSFLNTPPITVVATVSPVQATLCTHSSGHFHCVTTSTSVTSTITSYTISTTITTPTPTSSNSAGLPTLKNPFSGPVKAFKRTLNRWLDPDYLTGLQDNNHLPTIVTKPSQCPPGSAPPRVPCGLMCVFAFLVALFPALRLLDVRNHIRAGVFLSGGAWTVAKIIMDVTMMCLGLTVCTVWLGLTWYSCDARTP